MSSILNGPIVYPYLLLSVMCLRPLKSLSLLQWSEPNDMKEQWWSKLANWVSQYSQVEKHAADEIWIKTTKVRKGQHARSHFWRSFYWHHSFFIDIAFRAKAPSMTWTWALFLGWPQQRCATDVAVDSWRCEHSLEYISISAVDDWLIAGLYRHHVDCSRQQYVTKSNWLTSWNTRFLKWYFKGSSRWPRHSYWIHPNFLASSLAGVVCCCNSSEMLVASANVVLTLSSSLGWLLEISPASAPLLVSIWLSIFAHISMTWLLILS